MIWLKQNDWNATKSLQLSRLNVIRVSSNCIKKLTKSLCYDHPSTSRIFMPVILNHVSKSGIWLRLSTASDCSLMRFIAVRCSSIEAVIFSDFHVLYGSLLTDQLPKFCHGNQVTNSVRTSTRTVLLRFKTVGCQIYFERSVVIPYKSNDTNLSMPKVSTVLVCASFPWYFSWYVQSMQWLLSLYSQNNLFHYFQCAIEPEAISGGVVYSLIRLVVPFDSFFQIIRVRQAKLRGSGLRLGFNQN